MDSLNNSDTPRSGHYTSTRKCTAIPPGPPLPSEMAACMNKTPGDYAPMPRTSANDALGIGFERSLPKMKKGATCRVWLRGCFRSAPIVRRCPGPVYWATVPTGGSRPESVIVSCANWGGLTDAE